MSRIPPLAIASSFGGARPEFTRSISAESAAGITGSASHTNLHIHTDIETPDIRPKSYYPRMSGQLTAGREDDNLAPVAVESMHGKDQPELDAAPSSYFGARREQSPGRIGGDVASGEVAGPASYFSPRPHMDALRHHSQTTRGPMEGIVVPRFHDTRTLAPPRSPYAQRPPSTGSAIGDSDDDCATTMGAYISPRPRKMSSTSGISVSPTSPSMQALPRSPSVGSEISVGGTKLPRPAFNFSRPLSRASQFDAYEVPLRQASGDSQPPIFMDDTVHTPISMRSEELEQQGVSTAATTTAPSYVYSRFSLPRGKMLQRNSLIFQDQQQISYQYQQPHIPFSNVDRTRAGFTSAPPSPPSHPSDSLSDSTHFPDETEPPLLLSSFDRPSYERTHSPSLQDQTLPVGRFSIAPSASSGSTIRAKPAHSIAPSAEISAEDHVSKAIVCHEQGSLQESTYHLRIAARQNHPTGMLLYALACRHGWGMRANQKEGVQWLRKAADSASLEVADDEETSKEGKLADISERKTRRAQFALSIYELGISHMNGWGIEQDKGLALRCFEIAGCSSPNLTFLERTDMFSLGRCRRTRRGRLLLCSRCRV